MLSCGNCYDGCLLNRSLLLPDNFSASELHMVARRPLGLAQKGIFIPEHEDWHAIKSDIEKAWRQDYVYDFSRRVISLLRFRSPASYFIALLDKKLVRKNSLAEIQVPRVNY